MQLIAMVLLALLILCNSSATRLHAAEGRKQTRMTIKPNTPPPAGREASYEWYAKQYPDVSIFTAIGAPGDPGDTCVTADGQVFSAAGPDSWQRIDPRYIPDVTPPLLRHALAFAIYENGKIVRMGEDEPVKQGLVDDYLPIVKSLWKHGGLTIEQTAFAEPLRKKQFTTDNERTLAWAGITVRNDSSSDAEVTLLGFYTGGRKNVRPEMIYRDGAVFLDDEAIMSAKAEDGLKLAFAPVFPANASPTAGDESIAFLNDHKGVFNALVVTGKIAPGKTTRVAFNRVIDPGNNIYWNVIPAAPAVSAKELTQRSYQESLETAKANWHKLASRTARFDVPDPDLMDIYRKAILDGHFLTKFWEGRYICYDSVIYRCQWDSSSTNWMYALDIMGDHHTAEKLLDTVFERQGIRKPGGTRTREGCFSDVTNINQDGSMASWTSANGWALWAMAEHARLTGDKDWLAKHKKQIIDGCDWIIRERAFSKEKPDNPCAGLLFGKFVCDLFPNSELGENGYFAYTDAISYMGMHEMACLMSDWSYPEAERLLKESEAYREDIVAAIDRLTDKSRDPWFVPWALHVPKDEHRYFHDIVGPINLAFACGSGGVLPRDSGIITHVIRWIVDKVHGGNLEDSVCGGSREPRDIWPGAGFYSQDLAVTLLERDRVEEFLRMFYSLTARGISRETLTTTEWGSNTQPHIHSISGFTRLLRSMLIQERDCALYLLQGTPRAWLEQGRKIEITDAPSWYGPVSLVCKSDIVNKSVRIALKLPKDAGSKPIRMRLRLPDGLRIEEADANGKPLVVQGEWLVLDGLKGKLEITAKVAK